MDSVSGKLLDDCIDILLPGIKKKYSDIKKLITISEKETIEKYGASIYPNVIENILALSKHFKIFIVSNCQEWYLVKFIEFSNLGSFIPDWDCYGLALNDKPIMLSNIKKKNNIKRAVYIGDTIHDKESAYLSNTDFIRVIKLFMVLVSR